MQVSLNITSIDSSQNKKTKGLTYINPEATNAELKTAAQKFNAISRNQYLDAERIERMSVDEVVPGNTSPFEIDALQDDDGEDVDYSTIANYDYSKSLTATFKYNGSNGVLSCATFAKYNSDTDVSTSKLNLTINDDGTVIAVIEEPGIVTLIVENTTTHKFTDAGTFVF